MQPMPAPACARTHACPCPCLHACPSSHASRPLPPTAVLIDKAPMLDLQMASALLSAPSHDCPCLHACPSPPAAVLQDEASLLDLQMASALLSAPAKTLAPFPTPPAAAVLLDEASMLDLQMASALLSALRPDAQLVLVGDPNQLAPVGPGHVLTALLSLRCRPPAAAAAAAPAPVAAPTGPAAALTATAAAELAAASVSGAGAPASAPGTALLEGVGAAPASTSAAPPAAPAAVAAAPAAAGVAAGGIVYAVRPTRRQRMVRGMLTRLPMRFPGSDVNGVSSSDVSGGGVGSGGGSGAGGGGSAPAAPPDSPLVPRMQLNEIFRQAKGGAIVSGALQITRGEQDRVQGSVGTRGKQLCVGGAADHLR